MARNRQRKWSKFFLYSATAVVVAFGVFQIVNTSVVSDLANIHHWATPDRNNDRSGGRNSRNTPTPTPVATKAKTPTPTTKTPIPTPISTVVLTPAITVSQNQSSQEFGMSVGETLLGLSVSDLNARLDDMVSLGITWIRFDMDWGNIQQNNSTTYQWSNIDRLVTAANARHMKLLPILDYTPAWARIAGCSSVRCPPADNSMFATFAGTAVARYSTQGIHQWEIWNEPNLKGSWMPNADAAGYTNLLKATYTAIKNQDSSATVITGGMGPAATTNGDIAPISFLTQLYADGAKGSFDAVGMHPYTFPTMPSYFVGWNAWQQMFATNPSLRSAMTANGDSSKKIWMTEFGAPTGGPGALESSTTDHTFPGSPDHVTDDVQAAMYQDGINSVKNLSWAGPLFFYSYKDMGTSNSTMENFFGVIRFDGTLKPAYQTLRQLLTQ